MEAVVRPWGSDQSHLSSPWDACSCFFWHGRFASWQELVPLNLFPRLILLQLDPSFHLFWMILASGSKIVTLWMRKSWCGRSVSGCAAVIATRSDAVEKRGCRFNRERGFFSQRHRVRLTFRLHSTVRSGGKIWKPRTRRNQPDPQDGIDNLVCNLQNKSWIDDVGMRT